MKLRKRKWMKVPFWNKNRWTERKMTCNKLVLWKKGITRGWVFKMYWFISPFCGHIKYLYGNSFIWCFLMFYLLDKYRSDTAPPGGTFQIHVSFKNIQGAMWNVLTPITIYWRQSYDSVQVLKMILKMWRYQP